RLLAGGLALVSGIWAVEASSAELKVLSAGAMRASVQELASAFEAASGNKLKIEYANVGDIEKKVAAGGENDVAILTKPGGDKRGARSGYARARSSGAVHKLWRTPRLGWR